MNNVIGVILPKQPVKYLVFGEIAKCLISSLESLGMKAELMIVDEKMEQSYDEDRLYIMYCVEEFNQFPKKFICMQFEQLEARLGYCNGQITPKDELTKVVMDKFNKALMIWDYSNANIKFMSKMNINSLYVPYGFSESLAYYKPIIPIRQRDINVLWYGNKCDRRGNILSQFKKLDVSVQSSSFWDNDIAEFGPIVSMKMDNIKRAKIVLNIKYDEPDYSIIETPRIIHAIANGCLVVSESSMDSKLNEELKDHVVICHHSQMEAICLHYLANPDSLQKKIDEMYEWLTTSYLYKDHIRKTGIDKLWV